jgi:hypothetical protein
MLTKSLTVAVASVVAMALLSADAAAFGPCHRCCEPCPPPPRIQVVLQVCHPCTGCKIDVPVCIPACCIGAPCARFQRTLVGEGKTVFIWQCGYEVVVRYTHNGGYRVIDRG